MGDSRLSDPHVICRFDGDTGPYEGRRVHVASRGRAEKSLTRKTAGRCSRASPRDRSRVGPEDLGAEARKKT